MKQRCRRSPHPLLLTLMALMSLMVQPANPAAAETELAQAKSRRKTAPAPAPEFNLRGTLDTANRFYELGRYNDALFGYNAIIQRYPDHTAALIQAAKIYYRLDRYNEAATYFGRVALAELDPETSYEYGWAFFSLKNYDLALRGFQRVPPGHSLSDLANYYGGISAIKLKRFEVAEDMLEKALVLPDKLAKSRALYLKHVQALRLLHQQHELAKERELERETIALATPKKRVKTEAESAPLADLVSVNNYQGFKAVQKNANLQYLVEQQSSSRGGDARNTFNAKIATLNVLSGPQVTLPFRQGQTQGQGQTKERQGAVGLQLNLGIEHRDQTGTEQTVWADVSDQMLARQLSTRLGTKAEIYGKAGAEPWLELPLFSNLWFDIGGEINMAFGDFDKSKTFGYHRGFADLRGRYGFGTVYLSGVYRDIFQVNDQQILQGGGGTLGLSSEVATKLTLVTELEHQLLNYFNEGEFLDGPDNISSLNLNATQLLPLNLKIRAGAKYQLQNNYLFHNVPNYAQLSADGQNVTGKASLEGSPLPFISLGVSALVSSTTWQVHDEATKPAFEQSVPTYTQEVNLWAGVNLLF